MSSPQSQSNDPAGAPAGPAASGASATPAAPVAPAAAPVRASRIRKLILATLSTVFIAIAVGYGLYWYEVSRFHVDTDNAYVQGNVVQITPQISGTVLAINADDTDFVKAGQSLIRLDPADAQIALDQAEAQLAQTVREVRTLWANNSSLGATIAVRQAEIARAQTEVQRAQDDVDRRQALVATGAVSKEELQHSMNAVANAKAAHAAALAALTAAQEQLASNRSLTDGTSVESHPNVQRAAARVREAFLAVKRSDLPAPVSGYVAKRTVQLGQRVQAGSPMMAIIPLDQLWVDANFKEVQLRAMRIGQPVKLSADLYGNKVEYDGRIAGLAAGTGAAFSLLPAQNATGNWIKVVQRVPVRILLDARQLAEHPLRVGLSMQADVDVRDQSGKSLAEVANNRPVSQTPVFDSVNKDADELVDRIIGANLGRKSSMAAQPAVRSAAAALAGAREPAATAPIVRASMAKSQ